jgi:hypothetical protein
MSHLVRQLEILVRLASRPLRVPVLGTIAFALTISSLAQAGYNVPTSNSTSTATGDKLCSLTEAIALVNGLAQSTPPTNSDCPDNHSEGTDIVLTETTQLPFSSHHFQLGAGVTLSVSAQQSGVVSIYTSDGAMAYVDSSGPNAITVNPGAYLDVFDVTLSHTGSSPGRLVSNAGQFIAYDAVFQGGNVSGFDARGGAISNFAYLELHNSIIQNNTATLGGGLFTQSNSSGSILLDASLIQNNSAVNGRGGGIYVTSIVARSGVIAQDTTIQNNVAGEGGGIYADPGNVVTDLSLTRVTIRGNKAVSSESTAPTSANVTTSLGAQPCASNEGPTNAFDDSWATKWCNRGSAAPSIGPGALTLTYQFASPQIVSAYSITMAEDAPTRDPSTWALLGSNNGSQWTTLHSVVSENAGVDLGPSGTGRHLTHSFGPYTGQLADHDTTFHNSGAFTYYRLSITANAGNDKLTQFSELALFTNGLTGDGGGLYDLADSQFINVTFAQNIAGCKTSSCACSDAWCATTTNTSSAFGLGGALFTGSRPVPPEIDTASFITVAANSAAQGGGIYRDRQDDWTWDWSVIGKNSARNGQSSEADFHGDPHSRERVGGSLIGNLAGVILDHGLPGTTTYGFIGSGANYFDPYSGVTGRCFYSACDPDVTGDPGLGPLQYNGGAQSSLFTFILLSSSPVYQRINSHPSTLTGDYAEDERGKSRDYTQAVDWGATNSTGL